MVEVVRDPVVESFHRGAAVLVDSGGKVLRALGDVDRPVPPRSCAKPLQALALTASGAAEAFGLSDEHIALAAGSHSGLPRQTSLVKAWLDRLNLSSDDLACGALAPIDQAEAKAMLHRGEAPTALHHNCSGKHTGFLTLALHMGAPTQGYEAPDHPVQKLVLDRIMEITGAPPSPPCACDGCGVPTWALPLTSLALGMARLDAPEGLSSEVAAAAVRVAGAMEKHPDLVAGPGQFDTDFKADCPEVVVKTGAEGVVCGFLKGRGLGFAVKIDDGALRAAWVACAAFLSAAGISAPERWLTPPVLDNRGRPVGRLRPTSILSLYPEERWL